MNYMVKVVLNGAVDLTEPIDIYSEWIDAADEAERGLR
jgi:transcription elongation factor Elf1